MALIFMTGGESGVSDFTSSLYLTVSTDQKRTGNYSYFINNGYIMQSLPVQYAELFCSLAVRISTLAIAPTFLSFENSGTSVVSIVGPSTTAPSVGCKLYVGATLVATGNMVLSLNTWYILDLHIIIHDVNGLIHFKVNGLDDAIYVGNTAIIASSVSEFRSKSSNSGIHLDDIIINDTAGTINNSWMGGSKIIALRPIGPGSLTQWTPSEGANWECVGEAPISETDYVVGNIAGAIDLYDLSSLPAGVCSLDTFLGAKVFNSISRSGITTSYVESIIRTNSENTFTPPIAVPLINTIESMIWDLNPITGTTWTYADINALEVGVKLV